jgi:hypothetical protein
MHQHLRSVTVVIEAAFMKACVSIVIYMALFCDVEIVGKNGCHLTVTLININSNCYRVSNKSVFYILSPV